MLLHKKSKRTKWIAQAANIVSLIRKYFKGLHGDESTDLTVKVTINSYGMIILDGTIRGKRHRLSCKKRATPWNIFITTYNANQTFIKLYHKRLPLLTRKEDNFKAYGFHILSYTQNDRNLFTQKEELSKFRKLCDTFGSLYLHEIKASHILQWQDGSNMAPRTIVNYRSTLNLIFKYAVYDELMHGNPLSVVKVPKVIKHEIHVFTEEEISLLQKHSTGQLHNIIRFVAFTGVRAGELIALKWSDVDFKEHTITISRRVREGNEDIPKSKRIRVLDMLPQAEDALKKQAFLTQCKSEYIFMTRFGKPYKRSNKISAAISRICKKANVNAGTLQTLRRSCNTLYKQYGLPNDWILDQLGHMQEDVNRKHYTGRLKPDLSQIGTVLAEPENP